MAWFSSRIEPSAEEWGEKGSDSQGKNHSMLNFSSTLYTQTERTFHTRQTERIFRTGHVSDDHNRKYRPPQINLFKDHGYDINMYSHFPSIAAYGSPGSPKKAEGFSAKERLKGVPGYKNHSPFSWDNDDHGPDYSDDEIYDRHGGYEGSYSPKPVHTRPEYDIDYGMESPKGANRKPSFVPPPGRHQQYTVPVSTSPQIDAYQKTARNRPIGDSPPRSKPETDTHSQKTGWKPLVEPARHPQYTNRPIGHSPPRSKPETDTQSQKTGWKPLFEPARHPQYSAPVSTSPEKDAYHEITRNRPIGHSPPRSKPVSDTQSPKADWKPLFEPPPGRHPQYSASIPTSPRRDTHYDTANNRPIVPGPPRSKPESVSDYAVESPEDGKQTSFVRPTGRHPQYYAPGTTPPKKDTYNDTKNNRPIVPSPLQSKPESATGYASDSPKAGRNPSQPTTPVKDSYYEMANNSKPVHDNGKVSAHVMTRPRKEDHQQTIDSSEARKRYGGKAVNQPVPEEEYVGTIDCREAARKYKGIFVP